MPINSMTETSLTQISTDEFNKHLYSICVGQFPRLLDVAIESVAGLITVLEASSNEGYDLQTGGLLTHLHSLTTSNQAMLEWYLSLDHHSTGINAQLQKFNNNFQILFSQPYNLPALNEVHGPISSRHILAFNYHIDKWRREIAQLLPEIPTLNTFGSINDGNPLLTQFHAEKQTLSNKAAELQQRNIIS